MAICIAHNINVFGQQKEPCNGAEGSNHLAEAPDVTHSRPPYEKEKNVKKYYGNRHPKKPYFHRETKKRRGPLTI